MRLGARKRDGGRYIVKGIVLDPVQLKALDLLAKREERTRSFIVRRAIKRELELARGRVTS